MIITHTGDVTSANSPFGSTGTWHLTLTDHSTGIGVQVMCPGDLAWVAQNVKTGQVMEVVGVVTVPPRGGIPKVSPITLRAKSGTNEKEINDKSHAWSRALYAGTGVDVEALKSQVGALETRLIVANTGITNLNKEIDDLRTERSELLHKLEAADLDLKYERTLNGAIKEEA
jgi:hypothetical protein